MKRPGLLLLMVGLALASGCDTAQRVVHGDEVTYTASGAYKDVFLWGCVLAMPIGRQLRKWEAKVGYGVLDRIGFTLFFTGPVALVLIIPSMYITRVRIDSKHLEAQYGNWWAPYRHDIAFDDVAQIRPVTEVRHGDQVITYLGFVKKSGELEKVARSEIVEPAIPEILSRARKKGIPVVGLP